SPAILMASNSQYTCGQPPANLVLEREFTIYHASDVKDQLLAHVRGFDSLEMNLAQVTELDGAGVQLLMLMKREANLGGVELRLTDHSRVVQDTLELLNLASYFGDPLLISGAETEGSTS